MAASGRSGCTAPASRTPSRRQLPDLHAHYHIVMACMVIIAACVQLAIAALHMICRHDASGAHHLPFMICEYCLTVFRDDRSNFQSLRTRLLLRSTLDISPRMRVSLKAAERLQPTAHTARPHLLRAAQRPRRAARRLWDGSPRPRPLHP